MPRNSGPRRLSVLVLHSELGVLRGGGENFTRNIIKALAKRNHRVSAAFISDRGGRYPIPLPSGITPVPVRGVWDRQFGQTTLGLVGRLLPDDSALRRTWDRIQEAISWRTIRWHNRRFKQRVEKQFRGQWSQFDVVYVHGDTLLASAAAAHCPTVLRLPGPVTPDLAPLLRALHAVCANGDVLQRIRTFLGDHALELPVGIDSEVFQPLPSSVRSVIGWSHEHLVFGYVGRLTALKGVDLLASAFRDVHAKFTNARLLVVGKGEMEASFRSVLAKEVATGVVHIERDRDHAELADWYRAMDFLVLPSRYENFSNAFLEAIACGIPVLASNVGGNSILGGDAGLLFAPESVSALRTCLESAARESVALKKQAAGLSQYVRQHYDWSATAQRFESIVTGHLRPNEQIARQ